MPIAVVTGAGSGIGRAVSVALSGAGYTVVLAGRTLKKLDETAEQCSSKTLSVQADVANETSVDALFHTTRETFGRVDLLFNNAGTNVPGVRTEDLTLAQWKSIVDVNLTGAFLCAQAAYRVMKAQQPSGGRIINNGSISAHTPRANSIAYTATKHAVTGMTKSLALDGREFSIACGQIDIGNAATDMTAQSPEPVMDVQHVADAILYMAGLPPNANVLFMTVMATKMPYVGRG